MTYCLAIRVAEGTVFASDTRTHAGVDYVTSYRKLHVFQPADDRLFVVQSAGSLATTQETLDRLRRDLDASDGRESLRTVQYLFEAASYVGRVCRQVQDDHAVALGKSGVSGETTLLLGGQVGSEAHGLFLLYPQGNYIQASDDTPYLQIGESKYGKPMLDRLVNPHLSLEDAARLALVSLDATVRSNVTVGAPFDFAIHRAGTTLLERQFRVHADGGDYAAMRGAWQEGLLKTFAALPRFSWEGEAAPPPC